MARDLSRLRFLLVTEIARRREFMTMSASQRVGRGFHQLGLLLAATLLTICLPLMVADGVRLKLWDVGQDDILVLVAGVLIALVGLGIACLAVYGVVRAIGWVIGGFAAVHLAISFERGTYRRAAREDKRYGAQLTSRTLDRSP